MQLVTQEGCTWYSDLARLSRNIYYCYWLKFKNHARSCKIQQMNPLTNFISSATTHVNRDCLEVTISMISLCSFMLIYRNHPQHIIIDVISKYVIKQATNQQPNVIILISRENTTRIHM